MAGSFASLTSLNPIEIYNNTEDKPQSKVWEYNGIWWAVFPSSTDGTFVWRLEGKDWIKVLKISSNLNTKADVKPYGGFSYILLYRGSEAPAQLITLRFNNNSKNYENLAKGQLTTEIPLDLGVETATIDIDGKGRMWLASNSINKVNVRWSDYPYSVWSSPITIANNVSEDDICCVISMSQEQKIGVLWSNQNTQRFGFKTHLDGSSPATWSKDETPSSQSALEVGGGMADDHVNLAIAEEGTLYCAIKTRYGSKYPKIALLVRKPEGKWENLHEVSQTEGTTPIVILNDKTKKIKVVYVPSDEGGDLVYKESDTDSIAFGPRYILLSGVYKFPTSSKSNYDSNVVIFATYNKHAYSVLATEKLIEIKFDSTQEQKLSLQLYPNPIKDKGMALFKLIDSEEYSVQLYDAQGKYIEDLDLGQGSKGENKRLEIDGLRYASGLYFIRLSTKSETITKRVLITKN